MTANELLALTKDKKVLEIGNSCFPAKKVASFLRLLKKDTNVIIDLQANLYGSLDLIISYSNNGKAVFLNNKGCI